MVKKVGEHPVDEQKMITAAEYAKIKGKTDGWGRYIARKAKEAGMTLPRKIGRCWLATEEEWEKVLKTLDIRPRRPKTKKNR